MKRFALLVIALVAAFVPAATAMAATPQRAENVSPQSLLATAERTGVASTPRLWDRLVAWFADLIASL